MDKLPDRPNDVKVRVHKTKELFSLLPPKVLDAALARPRLDRTITSLIASVTL